MKNNRFVLSNLTTWTIIIYVLGAGMSGTLAYVVISNSMIEQNHRNLEAVLESRATLVEDYFRLTRQQVSYLSQNDMIVQATKSFTRAYETLARDIGRPTDAESEVHTELLAFYAKELRGQINAQGQVKDGYARSLQAKLPRSDVGRLAQWVYLVKNPNDADTRNELFSTSYESRYEDAHREYHPRINHFLKSFDFRDVFLLDVAGNMVYSTQKETDFATNFIEGPHSTTGLGRAYRGAMAANAREVVVADFEPYAASHGEPAAFFAAAIFEGERRVGAVIFQVSPQKLNAVISDLSGLGDSGETYIVGDDLMMRTDNRFAEASTILKQKVDTQASRESILGRSGYGVINDYRGVEVLSRYRPLRIDGLHWGMIAEIDKADVLAPAIALARNTLAVFALTLGVIAIVSIVTLRLCVKRPLSQLLAAADQIIKGDYSARVHLTSGDEFAVLAESQNRMASSTQDHIARLESAISEVKELQGLLPICSNCKSIRDGDGYFRTVETYLVGKSKIEFSHTICDECVPRIYPELDDTLKN